MKGVFNASVFMGRPLYPADITTVVSVYNAETDELVPTLWLDRDGTDELVNPHPLAEDGVILFYADPGRYNIVVEKGTMLYREWPDVIISDAATSGTPGIQSIVAGTNVTVDDTDPLNPVVSATGGGGTVETIVAGAGISVDDTDPANPIVTATGTPFDREVVQFPSSSSGILTIDCDYYYHDISLTENITSIVFENLPGSGKGRTLMLFFYQDSTPRTVAWPTSFAFTSGSETEVATGSGDESVLAISTASNGFSWVATMQYGGA